MSLVLAYDARTGRTARRVSPSLDGRVADRLFETCAEGFARRPLNASGPVVVLTSFDAASLAICEWIEELGTVGMVVAERDLPREWYAPRAKALSCLVLDEGFIGKEVVPGLIARVRHAAPELPVIVLSSGLRVCAFDPAQAWPADAVLRLPVSRTALKLGILSAIDNREAVSAESIGAPRVEPATFGRAPGGAWRWRLTGLLRRSLGLRT